MSLEVHGVMFRPDDLIEITYQEDRDRGEVINVIRTILIPKEVLRSDVDDLQQNAVDLIDAAILLQRNPADSEPLRKTT